MCIVLAGRLPARYAGASRDLVERFGRAPTSVLFRARITKAMLPELELPHGRGELSLRGVNRRRRGARRRLLVNVNTPTDLVVATSRAFDDGIVDRPVLHAGRRRVRGPRDRLLGHRAVGGSQAPQGGRVRRCRGLERSDEAIRGHVARLARALRRPRGAGPEAGRGSSTGPMPARSPRSSARMRITTSATRHAPCGRRSTCSRARGGDWTAARPRGRSRSCGTQAPHRGRRPRPASRIYPLAVKRALLLARRGRVAPRRLRRRLIGRDDHDRCGHDERARLLPPRRQGLAGAVERSTPRRIERLLSPPSLRRARRSRRSKT